MFWKYAPALRNAAKVDDLNAEAVAIFTAAANEVKAICQGGIDAEIIAIGAYGMLEEVFKRAKQKAIPTA